MGDRLTDNFFHLFCEKNSDGTKNLRLKGKELYQRIGKRLDYNDMEKVAKFLSNNLEIIKLDLSYNEVGDNGIEILVDRYLYDNENSLEHLNLVGCNVGYVGIVHLCKAAESLKLKTLRINGNKLGTEGGHWVSKLLETTTTLEHLDIGETDQTLGSVQSLMAPIREDITINSTLKVLDFSRIIPMENTYQFDPAHLAESLGEMLKVNSTLIELHIQKNEFDGHDIELLLLGAKRNKTLLLLDLGYNRIGDHGVELIAHWLKTRPALLGINISGNQIHDAGARALSFAIPFSRIRLLDISYNRIGNVGMLDILNSIKKPVMLRLFFIWGNKFDHPTNRILGRMFLSGTLVQEQTDIGLYVVDRVIHAAYYPGDHYKHRYYCVMDHGCPTELRIKRNKIEDDYAQPRKLIKFQYYDRIPCVDETLPSKPPPC